MATLSVWILGDQLLAQHPALEHAEALGRRDNIRVVMVESEQRLKQLPYHRKKLVLLLSAMRHYAEYLRDQGFVVDYRQGISFVDELRLHIQADSPYKLVTMAASEYAMRQYQSSRLASELGVDVEVVPNAQFLVENHTPYPNPQPDKRYRMESFYRAMRAHFKVLLTENGDPVGGQWNYDAQNRRPLPSNPTQISMPTTPPDAITLQTLKDVDALDAGVGTTNNFSFATTHAEADRYFQAFLESRLQYFGDYEDAMSANDAFLYHSVLSLYMNIGLLEPMHMIRAAEQAFREQRAPINAVEGFIRQILGWREFMYWRYWQQMPGLRTDNLWNADKPMPMMFWDGRTDMRCISTLVQRLLEHGYNHHIERLMVITNFCSLAGIRPAEVADWFLTFYIDAYDWVVTPNVIGMGLFADDGYIGTKPYIASANYINKMSDYCKECYFDPKQRLGERACPYNALYWNFLIKHEVQLRNNPRMGPSVLGLNRLDEAQRSAIMQQAEAFLSSLTYYESR